MAGNAALDPALRHLPRATIRIWRAGRGDHRVDMATAQAADGGVGALCESVNLDVEDPNAVAKASLDLLGAVSSGQRTATGGFWYTSASPKYVVICPKSRTHFPGALR
ncbi:hypothetical protein ACFWAY_44235 [Rhodococcus sp. NPDC059968]|uniref:hypothetical protein n=1 Tax=Rhodococcus sp. NPDC059968 TaxID=3347017 RepID=UPI00366CC6C1